MNTPPNPNEPTLIITIADMDYAASVVAQQIAARFSAPIRLYGVPRGGIPCVFAVAWKIRSWRNCSIVGVPQHASHIIDDVFDTGKTYEHYKQYGKAFLTLFDKRDPAYKGKWLVFPWEKNREEED